MDSKDAFISIATNNDMHNVLQLQGEFKPEKNIEGTGFGLEKIASLIEKLGFDPETHQTHFDFRQNKDIIFVKNALIYALYNGSDSELNSLMCQGSFPLQTILFKLSI